MIQLSKSGLEIVHTIRTKSKISVEPAKLSIS